MGFGCIFFYHLTSTNQFAAKTFFRRLAHSSPKLQLIVALFLQRVDLGSRTIVLCSYGERDICMNLPATDRVSLLVPHPQDYCA
mmetsp:Transcript_27569/g.28096  ORF Transcript_27569/g.28096 Transcript_27569/m.28096 type:complete len:84 (+) Transcript_27569:183-434(+)